MNMLEYKFAIDMATRAVMEGNVESRVESTDVNNAVDHLHEIGIFYSIILLPVISV